MKCKPSEDGVHLHGETPLEDATIERWKKGSARFPLSVCLHPTAGIAIQFDKPEPPQPEPGPVGLPDWLAPGKWLRSKPTRVPIFPREIIEKRILATDELVVEMLAYAPQDLFNAKQFTSLVEDLEPWVPEVGEWVKWRDGVHQVTEVVIYVAGGASAWLKNPKNGYASTVNVISLQPALPPPPSEGGVQAVDRSPSRKCRRIELPAEGQKVKAPAGNVFFVTGCRLLKGIFHVQVDLGGNQMTWYALEDLRLLEPILPPIVVELPSKE